MCRCGFSSWSATSRWAGGLAYSTRTECHLLNVPAARMGAFGDD